MLIYWCDMCTYYTLHVIKNVKYFNFVYKRLHLLQKRTYAPAVSREPLAFNVFLLLILHHMHTPAWYMHLFPQQFS